MVGVQGTDGARVRDGTEDTVTTKTNIASRERSEQTGVMTQQHTPGPWQLDADPDYRVNGLEVLNRVSGKCFTGERKDICKVSGGNPHEREANARLIAAAPSFAKLLLAYLNGEYTDPAAGLMEQFDIDVRKELEKAGVL